MEDLGDRIKANYENRNRHYLTRRMPVMLRLDGVAFHTFTSQFEKPFSQYLMDAMVQATQHITKKMQGFKCAYVQSDEISILLTDYDSFETCAWFDYNQSKLESVSAGLMSASFQDETFYKYTKILPYFDCRAFNVPKEEVVNAFLWRALDWKRNSLNMYAGSFFSAKELHKKNSADIHEMLHSLGKNWTTDLSLREKNGTFIFRDRISSEILPKYEDIATHLDPLIYCDKNEISN